VRTRPAAARSGDAGRAAGTADRVPLLRWPVGGRDRGGAGHLREHRAARLGAGARLVRGATHRRGGGVSLDAAAWQRLDAALAVAMALPPSERDAALLAALGDAPGLLRAAREALDPVGDEPDLARLAPDLLANLGEERQHEEDAHWHGRRIGPWRVAERIGAGGMGAVYRVERADGAFERVAALKLLPLSLQSAELRRRF